MTEINGAKRYPSPLSKMYPLMEDQIKMHQFVARKNEAVQCRASGFGFKSDLCRECRKIKIKGVMMTVDNIIL